MKELLTYRSSAGVRHTLYEREDGVIVDVFAQGVSDMTAMLERNQAMATHNDGYGDSRELRRVASIPASIRLKWLLEEGWDCLSPDPDCQRKLAQRLDDPDWAYLRTAPGRIGDHWRHHI